MNGDAWECALRRDRIIEIEGERGKAALPSSRCSALYSLQLKKCIQRTPFPAVACWSHHPFPLPLFEGIAMSVQRAADQTAEMMYMWGVGLMM